MTCVFGKATEEERIQYLLRFGSMSDSVATMIGNGQGVFSKGFCTFWSHIFRRDLLPFQN